MTSINKQRISIAVAALGGQGGGVLSNWIVNLAEMCGYMAQYTAIAGVAQRTGATIYSIELFPEKLAIKHGKDPVLALMPVAGDVDICLAAELMEAGRSVNRGIITPDKTTLIASDHRIYAIGEKEQMGDGRLESEPVRAKLKKTAKKLILFDMDAVADQTSSVISSVLFGALAASAALPFSKHMFEQTIKNSRRAVDTNLAGFELGYKNALGNISKPDENVCQLKPLSSPLLTRIEKLPANVQAIATYGVHRLVDYQDGAYGRLYLDRLEEIKDDDILSEMAGNLALWMSFEDVIRVADLKTRQQRTTKIIHETRIDEGQIYQIHDYFHPRFEEFSESLPLAIGRFCQNSALIKKMLAPIFSKGRIIRSGTIFGYIFLRFMASARYIRRRTLRYHNENKLMIEWLGRIKKYASSRPELSIEIAKLPKLIKGYGDTHARGLNYYMSIIHFIDYHENDENLIDKVVELSEMAQSDVEGSMFKEKIDEYT